MIVRMIEFLVNYSASIYDIATTTIATTTIKTTTTTAMKEKEIEDKKEITIASDGNKKRSEESLKKELSGFLRIVTKFTNVSDLPKDTQIDQLDFRIRTVSKMHFNIQLVMLVDLLN